ncbi:M20/M25/M40 family metallo-hydrolase [Kitasatospora sp. MAP5-34]|uniref:M20/M25/M40 family metallo-hydrolase n=1 Tax=Kitasatospora sp. MAP5-34 TaxID=3035102 RepID=UPI002473E5FF|nr:M20/M25/M40 family metallo-hydrolase [Kitasatospora sp. MAP5-34]
MKAVAAKPSGVKPGGPAETGTQPAATAGPTLTAGPTGTTGPAGTAGPGRAAEAGTAESGGQNSPAALPGLPSTLNSRARTLAGAVQRRCAELVAMESPTGDVPRLNLLAEELTAGFRATGAQVRRESGVAGDHLVLEWAGQEENLPHVLVVGHHDTVWPVGTLADWPVQEADGLLSGPGILDMKAGLALLEGAFALLADLGQRPHRPVRLVVVADEEVGSPDGRRLVERQLPGAAAVLGLEPPHPDGRVKTARRGSTRVLLTVTGREAHAGNDAGQGTSAVDELVDQLVAVRGLVGQPGTELNAGRISGGSRANVVAGRAEAELGLRFATAEAQSRTLDTLAQLTALRPGARVRTEVLSSRPAWPERTGDPLLRHVRSLAAVLGQQLDGAPAGGAGDTNLAGARGLPTLDGLGAVGAGSHARGERIEIAQLAPRIALLAALLAVPLPRLRDRP